MAKSKPKSTKKVSRYVKERDQFFKKNPNMNVLLAMFVVAFALFLGVQYHNYKAKQQIVTTLLDEDIAPPISLSK